MYLKEMLQACGLDSRTLGKGLMAGSFKHSNETSTTMKGGEFLDELSSYHLFKKHCYMELSSSRVLW
jgi:hypothetical protein